MTDDVFEPKLGRIRDAKSRTNLRTTRRVVTQAGRAGAGLLRQRGHIAPDARRRGIASGVLAPFIHEALRNELIGGDEAVGLA